MYFYDNGFQYPVSSSYLKKLLQYLSGHFHYSLILRMVRTILLPCQYFEFINIGMIGYDNNRSNTNVLQVLHTYTVFSIHHKVRRYTYVEPNFFNVLKKRNSTVHIQSYTYCLSIWIFKNFNLFLVYISYQYLILSYCTKITFYVTLCKWIFSLCQSTRV